MVEDNKNPQHYVFLLRCWWNPSENSWRFILENTQQQRAFPSKEALIDYLNTTFSDNATKNTSHDEK